MNNFLKNINKKIVIYIFVFNCITFCSLRVIFITIICKAFPDVINNLHYPYNIDASRYTYFAALVLYANFFIIIIISLLCFYIGFKRKYFKESLFSFIIFIIFFLIIRIIFHDFISGINLLI